MPQNAAIHVLEGFNFFQQSKPPQPPPEGCVTNMLTEKAH